jgi:hypothetical protein
VQALHQQQVHAMQQAHHHIQIQMQMQQMQQQTRPPHLPWLPQPSTPQGLVPKPGPPPIAATTPVALRPAAFASQMASALTLESLTASKPACGLALKPRGVLLPTAPPGHSYAVGPRRGAYLVLQPVVDRDGTAVFPPPRPSQSRQVSGRSIGRQPSKHGGRQSPALPPGGPFGLPYGKGLPHGLGMPGGYARPGAGPMPGYPPTGQAPTQPAVRQGSAPHGHVPHVPRGHIHAHVHGHVPGHAFFGHAPHGRVLPGHAAAPSPVDEAPQLPMALLPSTADAPLLPPPAPPTAAPSPSDGATPSHEAPLSGGPSPSEEAPLRDVAFPSNDATDLPNDGSPAPVHPPRLAPVQENHLEASLRLRGSAPNAHRAHADQAGSSSDALPSPVDEPAGEADRLPGCHLAAGVDSWAGRLPGSPSVASALSGDGVSFPAATHGDAAPQGAVGMLLMHRGRATGEGSVDSLAAGASAESLVQPTAYLVPSADGGASPR